jgi:hypothetical protein
MGERFLDGERDQSHAARLFRRRRRSKGILCQIPLFSGFENDLAPAPKSGNASATNKPDGSEG